MRRHDEFSTQNDQNAGQRKQACPSGGSEVHRHFGRIDIHNEIATMVKRVLPIVCAARVCTGPVGCRAQGCAPCDFDGEGVVGIEDLDLLDAEIRAQTHNGMFDFDGDGDLTAADIDSLARAMREDAENSVFDLNHSANVDAVDHRIWLEDLARSFFGDANLDGEFNSSDMVQVFAAGKYEAKEAAGWAQGDWSGDGFFGSSDMVTAFVDGGYEKGGQDRGCGGAGTDFSSAADDGPCRDRSLSESSLAVNCGCVVQPYALRGAAENDR